MVLLVFWLLQCCEKLWLANGFEIHYVSQEHGTVFLFWNQGLYSFGVTLGRKKKSISKFQNLRCKRVCNPWVSNTLAVYLDFLALLDFFLESFFLVFSGGGGGCSSSSLSSSSPCPSSSSSSSSLSSIFAPYRTFISTSKWTGSIASGSSGSSATCSLLLITAGLGALTLTLRCLHFNMQSLVNTINENLDSNENNFNTNRNWIATKPTHQ